MISGYSVQSSVIKPTCGPRQEPDPRNKISSSHYKILSKLTEIYCRWLSVTGSNSVQSSVATHTGEATEHKRIEKN